MWNKLQGSIEEVSGKFKELARKTGDLMGQIGQIENPVVGVVSKAACANISKAV